MDKDGITYRFIRDVQGSVRLVVDSATGAIAQRLDYDSFGNVLLDTNPGFQPFGFQSGLYDGDTALVQFGARWYDAASGRWLSKDPILLEGGFNLYVFCGNDPLNYADPLGLWGIQFGGFNVGIGAPSMVFDKDSWGELKRGAAATADGFIPVVDPFQNVYADENGDVSRVYKTSRLLGSLSRDALLTAGNAYAANKILAASNIQLSGIELFLFRQVWFGQLIAESTPPVVNSLYSVAQLILNLGSKYQLALDLSDVLNVNDK